MHAGIHPWLIRKIRDVGIPWRGSFGADEMSKNSHRIGKKFRETWAERALQPIDGMELAPVWCAQVQLLKAVGHPYCRCYSKGGPERGKAWKTD